MGIKVAGAANHSNKKKAKPHSRPAPGPRASADQQREDQTVETAENQARRQRGVTQRMKDAAAGRADHGCHSGGRQGRRAHGSSFQ